MGNHKSKISLQEFEKKWKDMKYSKIFYHSVVSDKICKTKFSEYRLIYDGESILFSKDEKVYSLKFKDIRRETIQKIARC